MLRETPVHLGTPERSRRREGRRDRGRRESVDGEGVLGVGDVLGQRVQRRILACLDLDIEVVSLSRMRRTTQDFAHPSDQHPSPQGPVLREGPPGPMGTECSRTAVNFY